MVWSLSPELEHQMEKEMSFDVSDQQSTSQVPRVDGQDAFFKTRATDESTFTPEDYEVERAPQRCATLPLCAHAHTVLGHSTQ